MSVLFVFTNCPDASCAKRIARSLVEARLAACVTLLPQANSIYHWQGEIESAVEVPLLIKTTTERYAAVEALIQEAHPYEIPEIIALPVALGLPAYLDWIVAETC